jgi:CheY-like chemotaxis protein
MTDTQMGSNQETTPAPHTTPLLWVVEDDAVSREWLQQLCERWGYRLRVAGSAAEVRFLLQRLTETERPQVLLLDLQLPDTDGAGVLDLVRAADIDAPALAMSADLIERPCRPDFQAWLRKPLRPGDLMAALRDAGVPPPRWDDVQGLRSAAGRMPTLHALRALLAADLPQQHARLQSLFAADAPDLAAIDGEMHRLLGAARLTGAAELAASIESLRECLERQEPHAALWRRCSDAMLAVAARQADGRATA